MSSNWPIRKKLIFGIGLLLVIVAALSWTGFYGVYAYRSLVRSLRGRAEELPLASAFSKQVSDLRVLVATRAGGDPLDGSRSALAQFSPEDAADWEAHYDQELIKLKARLDSYRAQLRSKGPEESALDDDDDREAVHRPTLDENEEERETVLKIKATLDRMTHIADKPDWTSERKRLAAVREDLDELEELSFELPGFLHRRIQAVAKEIRLQYRGLIFLSWITTVLAGVLLWLLIRLFYQWVFRPLHVLVEGSRRVAGGEFNHRIALDTRDEMSELADAMNDMTARFEAIRDDLDSQVRERTKQVVRSEQLASVGFLAAGVAHEINNPLASIALCAESLEGRIAEVLDAAPAGAQADVDVIRNYLRMIQDEAFRCKGITERLLDFSRMGDLERQNTDLAELVQGVIDMVGHLGRYQDKHIEFAPAAVVIAAVNAQELKQVVLNLITNGLDSVSPGGKLRIAVTRSASHAELEFVDDGCGMTEEVLTHLFEPFFTRRRNGQGTGLGLSITYRIVADHGGHIDVHSDGPGRGSRFNVTLPLVAPANSSPGRDNPRIAPANSHKESDHRYQAA